MSDKNEKPKPPVAPAASPPSVPPPAPAEVKKVESDYKYSVKTRDGEVIETNNPRYVARLRSAGGKVTELRD